MSATDEDEQSHFAKNEVVVINRNYQVVKPYRFFSSIIQLRTLEDKLFWSIVVFVIFFSDHEMIPLFVKIFFASAIWMIILCLEERKILSKGGKVRGTQPANKSIVIVRDIESKSISRESVFMEDNVCSSRYGSYQQNSNRKTNEPISIVQCDFAIPTIKILESGATGTVVGGRTGNDSVLKSDYLFNLIQTSLSASSTQKSAVSPITRIPSGSFSVGVGHHNSVIPSLATTPSMDIDYDEEEDREKERAALLSSRLLFKICVMCPKSKRWDVWRTYHECVQAYNQLVRKYPTQYVPKLSSFRRIKRNFQRDMMNNASSSYAAFNSLQQLRSIEEDDKDLLRHHRFFQHLQVELLQWLTLLRSSFELGEDEIISSLLNIPQSVKPLVGFEDRHSCVVPLILEPVDQTNFPDIIPVEDDSETTTWQAIDDSGDVDTTEKDDVDVNRIFEAEYGIKYKGNTIDTFEFLDLCDELRSMVSDSRYTHGFKLRGLNYMNDKRKIEPGPAIAKLILMDIFIVDVDKFGDRHDHVCAHGKARKRIEILSKVVTDLYHIFVYNLQIPGDPPYSLVFYFALAKDFHKRNPALLKTKKMFDRFIDIPITALDPIGTEETVPIETIPNPSPVAETTTPNITAAVDDSSRSTIHQVAIDPSMIDYDVIGEAKVITSDTPKRANDGADIPNTPIDITPTRSFSSASELSSAKIDEPQISISSVASSTKSPAPAPASDSTGAPSTSTPVTAATDSSTPAASNTTAPSRKNVTQKSWTSDIVWPEVGEPGVYDKKSFQNLRFKLVPKLLEAPWVLQMAVRSQPVIVGQKVVQRYFRGKSYIEVDLHVGSSSIANHVVSLCRTYSKSFVCNIGVVLQGENEDELPEEVLAVSCINRIDLDKAEKLE